MGINQLGDRKKREIEVGRAFIEGYNRLTANRFVLDESYWDAESDPAPDLRFHQEQESLFAEVVCFDEGGQEGFMRSSATGRLLAAVQNALEAAGAEGFAMMIEPTDPPSIPHHRQLEEYAYSLVRYVVEKTKLLREGRYSWDRQHEQAWSFVLRNLNDLDLSLTPATRAYCAVSGGVRMINSTAAFAAVINLKSLKRYGARTHLLIDQQGHFVGASELLEELGEGVVSVEGFEGVWFVSLQERSVVALHQPARSRRPPMSE